MADSLMLSFARTTLLDSLKCRKNKSSLHSRLALESVGLIPASSLMLTRLAWVVGVEVEAVALVVEVVVVVVDAGISLPGGESLFLPPTFGFLPPSLWAKSKQRVV